MPNAWNTYCTNGLTKIDELTGTIDQQRQQIRRLGLENELLAAMIAAPVQTAEITSSQSQAPTAEIPH